jgi:ribonuclease VapC
LIATAAPRKRSSATTSAACPGDRGRRVGARRDLFLEPEAPKLLEALQRTPRAYLSAANFLEIAIVIDDLDRFLTDAGIGIVPVTTAQARIVRDAYRVGKGNHPAGLNFGDCFAYALAKERDLPLLFKGDDFPQTDLRPAL